MFKRAHTCFKLRKQIQISEKHLHRFHNKLIHAYSHNKNEEMRCKEHRRQWKCVEGPPKVMNMAASCVGVVGDLRDELIHQVIRAKNTVNQQQGTV